MPYWKRGQTMIVKFHPRGRGGGAGPVDYLLGKDRQRDGATVLQGKPEILDAPVLADQHRLLGQLRADRPRGVEAGGAVRKFEFCRVGENDLHDRSGY